MPNKEFTNINGIKVCDQTARDSIPTNRYMPNITTFLGVSAEYIILGEGENIQKIELDDEPIQIAAGIPIEAVEDVIGEETISKKMAETGDYFGLRISGDSICNI